MWLVPPIPHTAVPHNVCIECDLPRDPRLSDTPPNTPLDLMHHCLNVDEIVRLIACELVASGGKATAVRLARCCKSFQDPVLDALWATQVGLSPLFGRFPGDVWREGGYKVSMLMTRGLIFPQWLGSKDFQTTPDGDGMDSFPEARSKNSSAQ